MGSSLAQAVVWSLQMGCESGALVAWLAAQPVSLYWLLAVAEAAHWRSEPLAAAAEAAACVSSGETVNWPTVVAAGASVDWLSVGWLSVGWLAGGVTPASWPGVGAVVAA